MLSKEVRKMSLYQRKSLCCFLGLVLGFCLFVCFSLSLLFLNFPIFFLQDTKKKKKKRMFRWKSYSHFSSKNGRNKSERKQSPRLAEKVMFRSRDKEKLKKINSRHNSWKKLGILRTEKLVYVIYILHPNQTALWTLLRLLLLWNKH